MRPTASCWWPASPARILDSTLARERENASVVDVVEVLVYRAELALRLHDTERAAALLASVRETRLDDAERKTLAEALAHASTLEVTVRRS